MRQSRQPTHAFRNPYLYCDSKVGITRQQTNCHHPIQIVRFRPTLGGPVGYAGTHMTDALVCLPLPNLKDVARDAGILTGRAEGKSYEILANENRCGIGTAHRTVKAHEDWVDAKKRENTRKVLEGLPVATGARLTDASNPESRTGPQSYRGLLEGIGWIGKGSLHIGDTHVSIGQVDIDARSIVVEGKSVPELEHEIEQLRGGLGVE